MSKKAEDIGDMSSEPASVSQHAVGLEAVSDDDQTLFQDSSISEASYKARGSSKTRASSVRVSRSSFSSASSSRSSRSRTSTSSGTILGLESLDDESEDESISSDTPNPALSIVSTGIRSDSQIPPASSEISSLDAVYFLPQRNDATSIRDDLDSVLSGTKQIAAKNYVDNGNIQFSSANNSIHISNEFRNVISEKNFGLKYIKIRHLKISVESGRPVTLSLGMTDENGVLITDIDSSLVLKFDSEGKISDMKLPKGKIVEDGEVTYIDTGTSKLVLPIDTETFRMYQMSIKESKFLSREESEEVLDPSILVESSSKRKKGKTPDLDNISEAETLDSRAEELGIRDRLNQRRSVVYEEHQELEARAESDITHVTSDIDQIVTADSRASATKKVAQTARDELESERIMSLDSRLERSLTTEEERLSQQQERISSVREKVENFIDILSTLRSPQTLSLIVPSSTPEIGERLTEMVTRIQ